MFKFLLILMMIIPMLLNGQISILSPFGGEYHQKNTITQIKWNPQFEGTIKISFSSDGGINWSNIDSNVDASLGSIDWTIPNISSTTCKIKIASIPDNENTITSYNFTIGDETALPRILVDEEYEDWELFSDISPDPETVLPFAPPLATLL